MAEQQHTQLVNAVDDLRFGRLTVRTSDSDANGASDPDDALQLTKFARLTTYKWLKTLPDEVFTHSVRHPEYEEPYTFEKWIDIYSAHIPGHIEQIQNNYVLWKKK